MPSNNTTADAKDRLPSPQLRDAASGRLGVFAGIALVLALYSSCSWLVVDDEVIRARRGELPAEDDSSASANGLSNDGSPNDSDSNDSDSNDSDSNDSDLNDSDSNDSDSNDGTSSESLPNDSPSATSTRGDAGKQHHAIQSLDGEASEQASLDAVEVHNATRTLAKGAAVTPPTVILISVDGLAVRFVEAELSAERLPGFARLQREGAFTHNARTEARTSVTLPNHTSMVTGRPADAIPGAPATLHHGLLDNYDLGEGRTIHNSGNPELDYAASVFDEVHDHGGYTSLYSGKPKFLVMQRSYVGTQSRADVLGSDNGRDKIDDFEIIEDTPSLVGAFLGTLRQGVATHSTQRNFAMLHLRDTDSNGHGYGWGSDEYLNALRQIDQLVLDVLDALDSAALSRTWVILTTDHGGVGTGHYDTSDLNTVRIPFYVWGPGVAPDTDLYALTGGTRVDPAGGIPMDGEDRQPIRNGDAGNLALFLLQLPPIDGSSHRGMTLSLDED